LLVRWIFPLLNKKNCIRFDSIRFDSIQCEQGENQKRTGREKRVTASDESGSLEACDVRTAEERTWCPIAACLPCLSPSFLGFFVVCVACLASRAIAARDKGNTVGRGCNDT
jgi:hypothetical protein